MRREIFLNMPKKYLNFCPFLDLSMGYGFLRVPQKFLFLPHTLYLTYLSYAWPEHLNSSVLRMEAGRFEDRYRCSYQSERELRLYSFIEYNTIRYRYFWAFGAQRLHWITGWGSAPSHSPKMDYPKPL